MNLQERTRAMLIESIECSAKQLREIKASEITSIELQRSMREQQDKELTGVGSTVAEQLQVSREDGNLPEQCTGEEEERWRC
jgi:hypothetical protein